VVLHLAAERRPDVLEKDKDLAQRLNSTATKVMAELSILYGSWLIYISTNYVFDGKLAPYAEDAAPCPLSVYGESKLAGEKAISSINPRAATLRVPLLYGPVEKLDETSVTVLLNVVKQPNAKLDHWQERFPTNTEDVAEVLLEMVTRYIAFGKADPYAFAGIFHWQANHRMTKYTMGLAIAEIAGLETSGLVALTDPPAPGTAIRPQFERMLCSRLEALLGIDPAASTFRSDFKETLARHLQPFL